MHVQAPSLGEFSVDIFAKIPEDAQRFYQVEPTKRFLDEVNATALEERAVRPLSVARDLQRRTRAHPGDREARTPARLFKAAHHGPAPDKLHIHLDLRPVTMPSDAMIGFAVDAAGPRHPDAAAGRRAGAPRLRRHPSPRPRRQPKPAAAPPSPAGDIAGARAPRAVTRTSPK